MEQYAVVNYDDRHDDDNKVEIICVTDNFEYAEKLAVHHAKKRLPKETIYGRTECRILKNYYNERNSVILRNIIVEYRVGEVEYDDDYEQEYDDERERYHITHCWNSVWAVVKIENDIEEVGDIDESIIYEC